MNFDYENDYGNKHVVDEWSVRELLWLFGGSALSIWFVIAGFWKTAELLRGLVE